MKKSLLALAVLGAFASAASAQSSVTIYGVLDLAVMKANGGNTFNPGVVEIAAGALSPGGGVGSAGAGSKAWFLQQSTASRLGFRGSEDLGGGLSAQFQIEHRFTPDNGAAASIFWAGRSFVQLTSAAAGSVYLGREYSPWFHLAANTDPFGLDGVGQLTGMNYMLTGSHETGVGNSGAPTGNGASRTQNTVGYKSPSLGGLTVQAAVGLGEGTIAGGRDAGINAIYAAGPIYAGIGYGKKTGGTVANDGNTLVNLAFNYDFGVAKLMTYYGRSKSGIGSSATNKFYSLGAQAPIGPGLLKVVYGRLDVPGSNQALDVKKFAIGYNYNLSKRTNLYADLSSARSDLSTDKNTSAYAFGLRHTF